MTPYAHSYELLKFLDLTDGQFPTPPGSRVLTLPEIMTIRRNHHPLDPSPDNPWNVGFVTSSREYCDMSPGGNGIVVVHHPVSGGLEPADGHVDRKAFRRLLDGEMGPVTVLDADNVSRKDDRAASAWPLLAARLGGGDAAYAIVKQVERQAGCAIGPLMFTGFTPFGSWREPQDEPGIESRPLFASKLRSMTYNQDRPLTARQKNFLPGYRIVVESEGERPPHGRTCVAVHDGPETPLAIAPPVTRETLLNDAERTGWRKSGRENPSPVFLREYDGRTMTDGNREQDGLPIASTERGWPEHDVLSFVVMRKLSMAGIPATHRLGQLHELAPPGANAYKIATDGRYVSAVLFGRAEIDTSMRMPDPVELATDWQARWQTAAEYGERWWRRKKEAVGKTRLQV